MVLAVPPDNWDELAELCRAEGVEATAIGRFGETGRLVLKYHGEQVADLSMDFLHDGRPPVVREATYARRLPRRPLDVRGKSRGTTTISCGSWARSTSAARSGSSASTITRSRRAA